MKKLLTISMFMLLVGLGFNMSAKAEDIVDLYPYDQEACLLATSECTYTKVGNSNWSFTYYGHKYHVIKDLVRYVSEMNDDNSDGFIEDSELAGIPYNAFASMTINNTDFEVVIKTANARTDITDVVHRKYAHFDENGNLAMFEDHISTYYIFNDGTVADPDWRLATQAEADAYDAADPKPETTRKTHIRIALDDTDSDGYVVEPIGYLKWTNADVDTTTELDKTKWSTIVADDPNNIVVPAGWTIVSFGTNDRGALNPKTTAYIESLPAALVAGNTPPMVMEYVDQPAVFHNLVAQDDDAGTPGINIVVDYNGTFTMPTTIYADWMNMFDDTDNSIIHQTEKLDFQVVISSEGVDLETITYTWNAVNEEYTPSAEQTVIDSSQFGTVYVAKYSAVTPSGDTTEVSVDIVIGVMPPKFVGVEDRYIDEGLFIDLLEGITADDGYGNDKTNSILISYPDGFNPYNPQVGEYQIDVEFTHHVHFDGITPNVDENGTVTEFSLENDYNPDISGYSARATLAVWDDTTAFKDVTVGTGWGVIFVHVGADGKMFESFNRYNWDFKDSTGTSTGDQASFDAWYAALTIDEGEYVLTAYGSVATSRLGALNAGDPVTVNLGKAEFNYDIVTTDSYMLTVDDVTAPVAIVVNDEYMIEAGAYANANDAILANVVAFDNYDMMDDLAMYVSSNGGLQVNTVGTYTVEVTVEDAAGNASVVTFGVEVVPAPLTEAEIQAMIDLLDALSEDEINALLDGQDLLTEADVQAMLDAQDLLTEADVQALIDASVADSGCGSAFNGVSALFITVTAILGTSVVFVLRKRS